MWFEVLLWKAGGPPSLSVSLFFLTITFAKLLSSRATPAIRMMAHFGSTFGSSSSFLRSTIGAFLYRFVVSRLHLSKHISDFHDQLEECWMLLIRDKSALLLLVVYEVGQQGAAWCHPHVTLRGPKLVFTVVWYCDLWTQSKSHFSLYVAQRAFTLRYKTCGSLQCVIRRRLAPTSIYLVVFPLWISRIAGGVFLPWFCYFVIILHLYIRFLWHWDARYEVRALPGIRHDGRGLQYTSQLSIYSVQIFAYIFSSIQQRTCRLCGSVGSCHLAAILLVLSSSVGIYTYVPCLYMNWGSRVRASGSVENPMFCSSYVIHKTAGSGAAAPSSHPIDQFKRRPL